jgi:hypothetical protein
MRKILIYFASVFIFVACTSNSDEKDQKPFTSTERKTIEDFVNRLTESFNKYEYDLVRNSWDKEAFRKRVKKLDNSEQRLFNQYYENELSTVILNVNIDIVNKLKYNQGRLMLSQLTFNAGYAEIVYSLIFSGNVDFWKYRIELINDTPKLTDYYSYRDELWQSDNMKNIMNLNSKYTSVSKERQQTNWSMAESERYLRAGDSIRALEELYNIPKTHVINSISIKRINLAQQISDSVFISALKKEKEMNNGIYINYLYCYYFQDTAGLNQIFSRLENEVGTDNEILDSLKTLNYFWR